jgi:hypothetical protein
LKKNTYSIRIALGEAGCVPRTIKLTLPGAAHIRIARFEAAWLARMWSAAARRRFHFHIIRRESRKRDQAPALQKGAQSNR